jgi:hypothetical protein
LSDNLFPKLPNLPDVFSPIALPAVRSPFVDAIEDNYASEFYKRLAELITDFDAALDQTQEVGVRLVSYGQTVVFRPTNMGYYNPSLICFRGVSEDGKPVELVQHVSQISVLLMALPREDTSQPKRPIGFAK